MSSVLPKILLSKPEPRLIQRLYNGRKIAVFEGMVRIADISGWSDNPRIRLAKRVRQEATGNPNLSDEEIFDLMKSDPEVRLKELRDDIIKNGLREPLTISSKGVLLDGNRRYFALRFALEALPLTHPNRQDIESVFAYVLNPDTSDEDERNVLVEENFSASLKIEWPDYVKAAMIVAAKEDGFSDEEIQRKYSWSKAKIKETLRIHEITNDFEAFATAPKDPEDELGGGLGLADQEAQMLAAQNYQFFNEAQKSFRDALKTDIDFKVQFFRWIQERKFASFPEVRIAHKAWTHPEARAAILRNEPAAAKAAKAILDYNARVHQSTEEAAGRIESFVRFLRELTVEEVQQLSASVRDNLRESLQLVLNMTKAAVKKTE